MAEDVAQRARLGIFVLGELTLSRLSPMPENAEADLLWGVTKIAAAIGRSQAATYYLLEKGDLPARKVRGRWVASRARLLAALTGHDAPAAA